MIVGAAVCSAIVAYAVHYSFGIFFKPLAAEFGWTRTMTSAAFALYMVSRGGFGILTGWATDKYGPKIVVAVGGIFIGLGLLLTSQISALWQLYLFYSLLVGLGSSIDFAPLVSTVSRWFTKKRGLATGIVVAGAGVGTAVMPRPASYFIEAYGWSTSYIILGIVVLVIIVLAALLLRRRPEDMGLLPYGGAEAAKGHQPDAETGKGSPSLDKSGISLRGAVRSWPFWALFVMVFLTSTCLYMVMVHIVPHVSDVGISETTAANLMMVIGISSICGRLGSGWVSDAIGRRTTLAICLFCQAAVVFSLMWVHSVDIFYVFAVVFGLAYGGLVPQFPLIAGELFGLRALGAIIGLEMLGTSLGGAAGPLLGGYVFDVAGSYSTAFLIGTIGLVISLILVSQLKPPTRKPVEAPLSR